MLSSDHAKRMRREAATIGGRALEVMGNTPVLNQWMYDRFAPFVQGDVLEVGSGIGNISRLIRPHARTLTLTEVDPGHLHILSSTFEADPAVSVCEYDLEHAPPKTFARRRFDAIIAINVIEHVDADQLAVEHLASLLKPDGHVLVYVPACPSAFGSMDQALGHYRRYTRTSLETLIDGAGLVRRGRARYMNLLGLPGWILNGRVLGRTMPSPKQMLIFERLMPLVKLEDRLRLPIGLGLYVAAQSRARRSE